MRKQQKIWQGEHTKTAAFPSYDNSAPSDMVVRFGEFLKQKNLFFGKIVDIGCGRGRNAVYMAESGLEVFALDYIAEAIASTKKLADTKNISNHLHCICAGIDEPWPFEDNYFHIAIDCFSSIDIETKQGREVYKTEMLRTLKPGGFAMVAVVSAEDEFEKEMTAISPGLEPNSTFWKENGKFQKNYSVEELRSFYRDFEIIDLQLLNKTAHKMGRAYQASNFYMVIKKP